MKTAMRQRYASQRGLTLIELVVVLAILVALAGLIIGNFPGLIKKASRSTGSSSIGDIDRAVQVGYTTRLRYPDGMDSLLNNAGTLATNLPNVSGNYIGGQLAVANLAAGDDTALISAGITHMYRLDEGITDVTWNATATSNRVAVASGVPVATLPATNAVTIFGQGAINTDATNSTYLVFGLGSRCDLVGASKNMLEAPVRFGESAAHNPKEVYQRYAMVFAIDAINGAKQIRYIGAAAIESTGLTISDQNLQKYWQN